MSLSFGMQFSFIQKTERKKQKMHENGSKTVLPNFILYKFDHPSNNIFP